MGSTQPPDVQEHSARATFEDVDASSEVEVTSHLNPAEPSKSLKEEPRVIAKEGNSGGVEVDQVSPSQSSGGVEADQVSPSQSSVVSQESAGSKGSTLVTDKGRRCSKKNSRFTEIVCKKVAGKGGGYNLHRIKHGTIRIFCKTKFPFEFVTGWG